MGGRGAGPGPEERLLEIGCGPGVALSLICERLVGGRMVAIDRYKETVRRLLRPGGALSLFYGYGGSSPGKAGESISKVPGILTP